MNVVIPEVVLVEVELLPCKYTTAAMTMIATITTTKITMPVCLDFSASLLLTEDFVSFFFEALDKGVCLI